MEIIELPQEIIELPEEEIELPGEEIEFQVEIIRLRVEVFPLENAKKEFSMTDLIVWLDDEKRPELGDFGGFLLWFRVHAQNFITGRFRESRMHACARQSFDYGKRR